MGLRPIFILGAHKSGSSLLRNLFDGHPDLFVSPVETHFFRSMGYWVDYDLRRTFPRSLDRTELIEEFTGLIQNFNKRENPLGDSDLKGRFDVEAFRSTFEVLGDPQDVEEVVRTYFQALHVSLFGHSLEKEKIVHKCVGMAENALELKDAFPEARFVHIVRNPYANLLAFRKFRTANGPYPLLDRLLRSLSNDHYFRQKNQRSISSYHVLRYEDLVAEPERTMRSLCGKLDLAFNDDLLRPTALGEDWRGNSTSQGTFQGISQGDPERWKQGIHPMEARFVNRDLPFVLNEFGYPPFSKKGFWKPANGENLKRYFYNRLYRFYDPCEHIWAKGK